MSGTFEENGNGVVLPVDADLIPWADDEPDNEPENPIAVAAGEYTAKGYSLVAFHSRETEGGKGPKKKGWGKTALDPKELNDEDVLGLNHGLSRTVVIDGDNLDLTRKCFEFIGLDVDAMLGNPPAYVGNPERRKWLYKLPDGFVPDGVKKLTTKVDDKVVTIFEVRGAPADKEVQDVLPPSPHKETGGNYRWLNDLPPRDELPELPKALLDVWSNWAEWRQHFKLPLGERVPAPKDAQTAAKGAVVMPDDLDPVRVFNAQVSIESELLGYVYKNIFGNRWLRPESTTGASGCVLYQDADGVFAYEHGGGVLSDGHKHDAFDCMRLLRCDGDWKRAYQTAEAECVMPDGRTLGQHRKQAYAQRMTEQDGNDFNPTDEFEPLGESEDEPIAKPVHPLTRFVPLDNIPQAPTFLIEGVLCDKLSVLGSYPGKGKTSAMVSVALVVAGAMKVEGLEVKAPRHVIYVSEHPEQVQGIISGLIQLGLADKTAVFERFHLAQSQRMSAAQLVGAADTYGEMAVDITRNDVSVKKMPYVILDTAASTIDIDDENDNAGWSRAIATIKERLKCPMTIVLHTSKAHKHGQADTMTIRGASSIEGDVAQVTFLSVDEGDTRFIEIGIPKHRFEASYDAIQIESHVVDVESQDEFGEMIIVPVRVAELVPMSKDEREEARKKAEDKRKADDKRHRESETKEKVIAAREGIKAFLIGLRERQAVITQDEIDKMTTKEVSAVFPTARHLRENLEGHPARALQDAIAEMRLDRMLSVETVPPRNLRLPGGRKYVSYIDQKWKQQ